MKAERKLPHVVCDVAEYRVAFGSADVREILILPNVVPVPGTRPFDRGVIHVRGDAIEVLDLRIRLGLPTLEKERESLVALLHTREEDHKRWLKELLASVEENRPFALATDPHKCAFGKWYDVFRPRDTLLAFQMRKFDAPHRAIHAVAIEVGALRAEGRTDDALRVVERTRDTILHELIDLFDATRLLLGEHRREIGVVVEEGGRHVAVAVDSVESVERLEAHAGGTAAVAAVSDAVAGVGMRAGDERPVLLLDPRRLFA